VELTGTCPPLPIVVKNTIGWYMHELEDYDFEAAIIYAS
jgi:hypothetical protein